MATTVKPIKASAKAKMNARYHRLVDRKFAGTLTAAEAAQLKEVKATFDALNAPAAEAMKRKISRELADVDRVFAEIQSGVERRRTALANAASSQKANSAGSI
jgi:hypothetical protein